MDPVKKKPKPVHNRYLDVDRTDLYSVMQYRAAELMARDEAFATDTAQLLLAAAFIVDTNDMRLGAPAYQVRETGTTIEAEFGEVHNALQRTARWDTYKRALDAAGKGRKWEETTRINGARPADLALTSEEGLMRVLRELDRLKHSIAAVVEAR